MTKYAIFAGQLYYPGGGWQDLQGIYKDKYELKNSYNLLKNNPGIDWIQVVNLKTLKVIKIHGHILDKNLLFK